MRGILYQAQSEFTPEFPDRPLVFTLRGKPVTLKQGDVGDRTVTRPTADQTGRASRELLGTD